MELTLIQRARNIAADVYLAMEAERHEPVEGFTPEQWAEHVRSFERFTRDGSYDHNREVRIALAALRSITPPTLSEAEMAELISEDEAAERAEAEHERIMSDGPDMGAYTPAEAWGMR